MSKQHLADMLKSITTGDMEAAAQHFSKYSTEKSQEILSREPSGESEVEAAEANEVETAEANEVAEDGTEA